MGANPVPKSNRLQISYLAASKIEFIGCSFVNRATYQFSSLPYLTSIDFFDCDTADAGIDDLKRSASHLVITESY